MIEDVRWRSKMWDQGGRGQDGYLVTPLLHYMHAPNSLHIYYKGLIGGTNRMCSRCWEWAGGIWWSNQAFCKAGIPPFAPLQTPLALLLPVEGSDWPPRPLAFRGPTWWCHLCSGAVLIAVPDRSLPWDAWIVCVTRVVRVWTLMALTREVLPPFLSRPINGENREKKFIQCGHIGKRSHDS